jgi:hypothetical protein
MALYIFYSAGVVIFYSVGAVTQDRRNDSSPVCFFKKAVHMENNVVQLDTVHGTSFRNYDFLATIALY